MCSQTVKQTSYTRLSPRLTYPAREELRLTVPGLMEVSRYLAHELQSAAHRIAPPPRPRPAPPPPPPRPPHQKRRA